MCFLSHHAQQNAWGEGDLVQCGKRSTQVGGGNSLDVERVQAHGKPTEEAEDQATHNEHLKGL